MEYKTVSLADQVFERLEADILSGRYKRGETITEQIGRASCRERV